MKIIYCLFICSIFIFTTVHSSDIETSRDVDHQIYIEFPEHEPPYILAFSSPEDEAIFKRCLIDGLESKLERVNDLYDFLSVTTDSELDNDEEVLFTVNDAKLFIKDFQAWFTEQRKYQKFIKRAEDEYAVTDGEKLSSSIIQEFACVNVPFELYYQDLLELIRFRDIIFLNEGRPADNIKNAYCTRFNTYLKVANADSNQPYRIKNLEYFELQYKRFAINPYEDLEPANYVQHFEYVVNTLRNYRHLLIDKAIKASFNGHDIKVFIGGAVKSESNNKLRIPISISMGSDTKQIGYYTTNQFNHIEDMILEENSVKDIEAVLAALYNQSKTLNLL